MKLPALSPCPEARVLAEVQKIRFEQSPLGRAQRQRQQATFYAMLAEHRAEMARRDALAAARAVASWQAVA